MIQDIDAREAQRIGSVIGTDDMVQAVGCSYTQRTAGGNSEKTWDIAGALSVGRIIGRMEMIEQDKVYQLPPLDSFRAEYVANIVKDETKNDSDKEAAIDQYVRKILWQAFRYGYYQALDDRD